MIWNNYQTVDRQQLTSKVSTAIISCLGDSMEAYFKCLNRRERTRYIKRELVKLGHQQGYKVYANGLNKEDLNEIGVEFVNREWLFDVHWYTDAESPYTTRSLPLAVECEWNPRRKGDGRNPFSGIKYDFQKLLVTNAQLRLMIFTLKKVTDLDSLGDYFQEAIRDYTGLNDGEAFLFIAYDTNLLSFHYGMINK